MIVCLDPGHGGVAHPGGWHNGIRESDYALGMMHLVKMMISPWPIKVVMTRERDRHIPLSKRGIEAQEQKASLVISLHVNGLATARHLKGMTLYYWPEDYKGHAMALAMERTCPYPLKRGRYTWEATDDPRPEDDWLQRPRAVLKPYAKAKIPALLVEAGFSTNKEDAYLLKQDSVRFGLATSIMAAIARGIEVTHGW